MKPRGGIGSDYRADVFGLGRDQLLAGGDLRLLSYDMASCYLYSPWTRDARSAPMW